MATFGLADDHGDAHEDGEMMEMSDDSAMDADHEDMDHAEQKADKKAAHKAEHKAKKMAKKPAAKPADKKKVK